MGTTWAVVLVTSAEIYALVGFVFAVWFVVWGVGRVDPVADDCTVGFRVLAVPGVVALWPLFAWRLLRGVTAPPDEQNPHRDQAMKTPVGGASP